MSTPNPFPPIEPPCTTRCGRCGTIDGCVCPGVSRPRPAKEIAALMDVSAYADDPEAITLRDHFAGLALPSYIKVAHEHPDAKGWTNAALNRAAATMAYDMADAMLAAREVKS